MLAPLLLTLFLGVMDLGRALNAYIVLSHIAAEGVRTASGAPALEPGVYTAALASGGTPSIDDLRTVPGQYRVQSRVKGMAALQNFGIRNLTSTSTYNANTGGVDNKTVAVNLSGDFESFLPFLGEIRISSQKSGPYLLFVPGP